MDEVEIALRLSESRIAHQKSKQWDWDRQAQEQTQGEAAKVAPRGMMRATTSHGEWSCFVDVCMYNRLRAPTSPYVPWRQKAKLFGKPFCLRR